MGWVIAGVGLVLVIAGADAGVAAVAVFGMALAVGGIVAGASRSSASRDRAAAARRLAVGRGDRAARQPDHVPPRPAGAPLEPWGIRTSAARLIGTDQRREAFESLLLGLPVDGPEGVEVRLRAALLPDPTNPGDAAAVAVEVEGRPVGYLDDDTARRWQPRLSDLAASGQHLVVPARVRARRRGKRVDGAVTLDLPEPSGIRPANPVPQTPYVVLPTGSTVQVVREEDHLDVLSRWTSDGDVPVAVTLHTVTEDRARSTVQVVEARLDGERVGVLSPAQTANLLALVSFFEARGLVPVARATLRGNQLKADVTLHVVKARDADPRWLATFGPERPTEPDDPWAVGPAAPVDDIQD